MLHLIFVKIVLHVCTMLVSFQITYYTIAIDSQTVSESVGHKSFYTNFELIKVDGKNYEFLA